MSIKAERMKNDLKRGLSQVFLKKGLNYILLVDVVLSADYRYAKIFIDVLKNDLQTVLDSLNENPLHKEIVKDLHFYVHISNFPKIQFFSDCHKERIKKTEELFEKIKI
ncbi:ribosome-binding factor A [Alphaproteobacteria bacterium endosymbiont of Tiliacea citrago]|uniref:ribosome-binding factor A n=1 Tax=Alphaproteobacteria bacterium endosymbiont of Tiliacea citrago TaxID=3077944 RepID=UPI00313DBC95